MRKIYIVTGATGFVGNNVVKALENKGETVVGLVRTEEKVKRALKGSTAKMVYGDIRDPSTVDKLFAEAAAIAGGDMEYVFIHTASVVLIGGKKADYRNMSDVTVNGAKNVIEACIKHQCRLLYVSSVHAITEQPKRGLMTEIDNFDPKKVVGKYAKSKAEASGLVMQAVRERGLNAVLVHPSGITGPGDYSGTHLTQMAEDYIAGRIPAATKGGYDFVDVRDVADGIIAAASLGKAGDCYLLSNKYYTAGEMLGILHTETGGKRIKKTLPIFLARLYLPIMRIICRLRKSRPLFTRYSLYTLKSNSNFSHEKAARELNFNPRELKKSLADTVKFLNKS